VEPELPPSLSEAHKQLIGLAKETAGVSRVGQGCVPLVGRLWGGAWEQLEVEAQPPHQVFAVLAVLSHHCFHLPEGRHSTLCPCCRPYSCRDRSSKRMGCRSTQVNMWLKCFTQGSCRWVGCRCDVASGVQTSPSRTLPVTWMLH
jgi:hypothetical protein